MNERTIWVDIENLDKPIKNSCIEIAHNQEELTIALLQELGVVMWYRQMYTRVTEEQTHTLIGHQDQIASCQQREVSNNANSAVRYTVYISSVSA